MTHQVSYFCLYGDFEIPEVTAALAQSPSSTIEKDDIIEVNGKAVPAGIASWELYGPGDSTMEEQVDFLVSLLWQKADAVRALATLFSASLNCVFTRARGADVMLRPEVLQKLGSLNLVLNCSYIAQGASDAEER